MPLPLDEIRAVIADAVAPRHFFVGNGLELEWEHAQAEDIPCEIYKGRLLDASQTRERRRFEAWNIYSIDEFGRSTEPLLSVKLDAEMGEVHVVRAILCYAWEAYESSENVIESRETTKWVRELVGTINLGDVPITVDIRGELESFLSQAVFGTSRLPLTSLESPLPAFLLGRLAYFHSFCSAGARSHYHLMPIAVGQGDHRDRTPQAKARALETILRSVPWSELADAAVHLFKGLVLRRDFLEWEGPGSSSPPASVVERLFETLFNEITLSPFTDVVEKTTRFLRVLAEHGHIHLGVLAAFWTQILRQLGRHLTAYDLITFHHQGANYPDALLLDSAIKECLSLAEQDPNLFLGESDEDAPHPRLRRRAVRQACLLRRAYEGHLVPDGPTSPGENTRVLPLPYVRVPAEQIANPAKRVRRLYDCDPLAKLLTHKSRQVLRQSLLDLNHPSELRELGMAIFLDRPLGAGKQPLESDRTPLFSYLAFSRALALRRLEFLATELGEFADQDRILQWRRNIETMEVVGVPLRQFLPYTRTAIVSLADARKVADDFVFISNTLSTLYQFCNLYDLRPLMMLANLYDPDPIERYLPRHATFWLRRTLILPTASLENSQERMLAVYDSTSRKRAELALDPSQGFATPRGIELPVSPLRITRIWEAEAGTDQLRERDLSAEPILLQPPRW
jgi:hypothetical protein